jgi:mRNA-degrading endonuclease RelE of RelBE toxin-antitoxin system
LFEVIVSEKAVRQLQKLPRHEAERILAAVEKLADWPQVTVDVAKLVGEPAGTFRLRVGGYRCNLRVETKLKLITVASVKKRQRAYS